MQAGSVSPPPPTSRDWGHLLLLSFMWGTSFLCTRVGVTAWPATSVVAARLLLGAGVLLAVLRASGHALPRDPASWRRFLVLALLGNAIPFSLITWGQAGIDSGLAAILLAIMPLGTLVLAHFTIEGERMTPARVGGFVVGFLGLVLLVGPAAVRRLGGEASELPHQLAVVAGAFCYSANAIFARRLPPTHALVNTTASVGVATLIMVPIALVRDRPWTLPVSLETSLAIGWLGVVSTAAATIVYFGIIASAGPTFMSLTNYLIPIVAVVLGVTALGEELSPRAIVALAVILAGIAISQRPRRP
jgi:drug/metabolite transporter (DMT)-like permease